MFQINHYAIKNKSCYPIKPKDARRENENGADIYWTLNNFTDFGKRKKEDLKEITTFFCEIDSQDKKNQLLKIINYLKPSCVIETKRGFHVYWYLKNPIECTDDPITKADWYRDILKNRICLALEADTQAADACRLLRMPFYRYWKDGHGDFVINIAYESDKFYEIEDILKAFPEKKEIDYTKYAPIKKNQKDIESNDFWTRVNRIDCSTGLKVLSGTQYVNYEKYSFKKQKNQIRVLVNGKPSNVWIDEEGFIGSTDRGGPTIPNWIYWYQQDWKKVADILKEVFNVK